MTFTDAFLQLEVVACIKSVMNSKIGLDFVASHEESTRNLARGEVSNKQNMSLFYTIIYLYAYNSVLRNSVLLY